MQETSNRQYDDTSEVIDAPLFLSAAQKDLTVILEEWKQLEGHRKLEWNLLHQRATPPLQALMDKAQSQEPETWAVDPIKVMVDQDTWPVFAAARRQLQTNLQHIKRDDVPMNLDERMVYVNDLKVEDLVVIRPEPQQQQPVAAARPRRKRTAPKRLTQDPPTPTKRSRRTSRRAVSYKEVEYESKSDDDDRPSLDDDFGLEDIEEELAWLLEEFKSRYNRKRGMWEYVESKASPELKLKFRNCKQKRWFKSVPLQFLVKQSRLPDFRQYRKVVHRSLQEDSSTTPRASRQDWDSDEAYDDDEDGPGRAKRSRSPSPEEEIEGGLPSEYKELANLTIRHDGGQQGLWCDIFESASPRLQVLLRKETPRSDDSPPESLVPLHLRPAFRDYCAEETKALAPLHSKYRGRHTLEAQDSIRNVHRRKKKRLNMVCSRLESDLADFRKEEEELLEAYLDELNLEPRAEDARRQELARLFESLEWDLVDFQEKEEEVLSVQMKHFRRVDTTQSVHDVYDSLLESNEAQQSERIERFVAKLEDRIAKYHHAP